MPSSSNHTSNKQNINSQYYQNKFNAAASSTCTQATTAAGTSFQLHSNKTTFIYEKLNKQRLSMIDLLLKNGADKYMISKLSVQNLYKMNKKSRNMLKKWYGISNNPTSSTSLSMNDLREHISDMSNINFELRPLSPIMASLCLDDVDIFSRLYKHHHILFNYFKPDEDYELIYYAIKFQSKNCLVYLLTNTNTKNENLPNLLEQQTLKLNETPTKQLNKNVDTMFYILENTRSSKIIRVLLKCGFDLTKREQSSGNTALHCLFNASASLKPRILNEFHTPKSLSKILFIMLKKGGLKVHVNSLNYDKKLCIENLFEWDELVELVFFINNNTEWFGDWEADEFRQEWQQEFKSCVHLLIKSGADLLLKNNNESSAENGESQYTSSDNIHNCIDTLFDSLLKHSLSISALKSQSRSQSPIPDEIPPKGSTAAVAATPGENPGQSPPPKSPTKTRKYSSQYQQKNQNTWPKTFDLEFLYNLLNDSIDLNKLAASYTRLNNHYHHHINPSLTGCSSSSYTVSSMNQQQQVHRIKSKECVVEKFLEILLNVSIQNFNYPIKLFKMLCYFQRLLNLNNKMSSNHKIKPHIIKKFIANWLLVPNFLNSSYQFEKNFVVKSIIIELVLNDLYDLNDTNESCLLNFCIQMIPSLKSVYQLELIYDLMTTLIQYGATPCLDSEFHSSFNYLFSVLAAKENHQISSAQFYIPFGRVSPQLTHHHHHHRKHPHHHHYADHIEQEHGHDDTIVAPVQFLKVSTQTNLTHTNTIPTITHPPVTPSPSYASLLTVTTNPVSGPTHSSNVIITQNQNLINDSSIMNAFSEHYKRFLKLIYDSINADLKPKFSTHRSSLENLAMPVNQTELACHYHSSYSINLNNYKVYNYTHMSHHFNHHSHHHHHHHNSNRSDRKSSSSSSGSSGNYSSISVQSTPALSPNSFITTSLNCLEPLDMYLERLESTPRSLKSLARRVFLNRLVEVEKQRKRNTTQFSIEDNSHVSLIENKIAQMHIKSKRVKNYLLFLE